MKKIKKRLIGILLLISLAFSFASCDFIDDILIDLGIKYEVVPAKPPSFTDFYECHWVETLDELKVAIEHLSNANNRAFKSLIPTYENGAVDIKWLVTLVKNQEIGWVPLEEGDEWYDRKELKGFYVEFYVFFEEIGAKSSANDFQYLNSGRHYKCLKFSTNKQSLVGSAIEYGMSHACIECGYDADDKLAFYMEEEEQCFIMTGTSKDPIATIKYYKMENHTEELPENFHQDFIDSILIVHNNRYYQNGARLE